MYNFPPWFHRLSSNMSARIVILLVVALQAVSAVPIETKQTRDTSYRLPETTPTPVKYVITLTPNLEQSTFTGNLILTITAKDATNTIVLHSKDITVSSVKVTAADSSTDLYVNHDEDSERDFLTVTLSQNMEIGTNYDITIGYAGILHDDMYGFYLSTYTDASGNQRTIASTQFQPTHARKAFPCFDEPKYKAVFKISINTPAGYHSLSNTPLENTPETGVAALYQFKETPKMSTYLIAFVVSDFDKKEKTDNGIEFKTWARSNAIEPGGQYSIDVTPSILSELEQFTGIPYSRSGLTKVDQVAMPDFSAGAMENWGLVTYRERMLLWTEGVSTSANQQSIAAVISHELAHMWFGNLVTTDWWDTTWLNEGFATYFENYITDMVRKDFRIMDQFIVSVHQGSMGTDALPASHPLTHVCYTPAEVSAMFSTITYSKGGSVLRMFNHSITEEKFKAALNSYLTAREFDTAVPSQLMEHLNDKAELPSGISFTEVVKSWTEQAGFPVVEVIRNYESKTATVTQSRFLLTAGTEADNTLYQVPLNWATEGDNFTDTSPKDWLITKSKEVTDLPEEDKWVIFNVQETGYYRVHYDERNWNLLSNALNQDRDKIHPLNRAQLIDDAFNLARIGKLEYSIAFGVANSLMNEDDYIPWLAGLNAFSFLNRRVMGHNEYQIFQAYLRELLSNIYSKLEFHDEGTHVEKLHRSSVLNWACNMGHDQCLTGAADRLKDFVDSNGENTIEPNLQSVVYCYGLKKNTDKAIWEFLWDRYKTSNDQFEKTLLLQNLGCTENKEILETYLGYSIDESSGIRRQDASTAFAAVYGNPQGLEIAIKFLSENFDKIVTYYGSMGSIGNIVRGVAAQITNEEQKTQFDAFLAANAEDLGSAKDSAEQTVAENLAWSTKYQGAIFQFLKGPDEDDGSGMIATPALTTFLLTLILCVKFIF